MPSRLPRLRARPAHRRGRPIRRGWSNLQTIESLIAHLESVMRQVSARISDSLRRPFETDVVVRRKKDFPDAERLVKSLDHPRADLDVCSDAEYDSAAHRDAPSIRSRGIAFKFTTS